MEYGLIAVAIAALISVAVYAFGHVVDGTYAETCVRFADQRNDAAACP